MNELYNGKIKINDKKEELTCSSECHLDPDINMNVIVRQREWRPVFGQIGGSQTHLENNNVRVGDIFLFFGWFRETIERNGKLVFDPRDPEGKHVIYGYMQVGEIYNVAGNTVVPDWIGYHPHCCKTRRQITNNTIYVAAEKLSLLKDAPGSSAFKKYSNSLCLTKQGCTRSKWCLPEFFKQVSISHHSKKSWRDGYF